jgi:hypothetical protein
VSENGNVYRNAKRRPVMINWYWRRILGFGSVLIHYII